MLCRSIHLAKYYFHPLRKFLLLHLLLLLGTVKDEAACFSIRDKLPSTLTKAYSYALLKIRTRYWAILLVVKYYFKNGSYYSSIVQKEFASMSALFLRV